MQRTINVRQTRPTAYSLPQRLPAVDGYVATQECTDIGTVVLLRPVGTQEWESFLIVDCASKRLGTHNNNPHDSSYAWMVRNNIIVEVDYETAVRWNTIGHAIEVEMRDLPTPERYEYQ